MKYNKKINYVLLVVFTAFVLYFSLKDEFFEVIKHIFSFNKFWLLISVFLVFAYYFLKTIVIYKNAQTFNKNLKFREAFKINLGNVFVSAVTPFASGGQPYVIYKLKKNGLTIGEGTNVALQDFIVYQIALVFLGLCALFANYFFDIFKAVTLLKYLVTIGFVVNTVVIGLLFLIAFGKKSNKAIINFSINLLCKLKIVKDKNEKMKKWNIYIEQFHESASKLMNNKFDFILKIVLNLFALCALYLVPLTLLYSTGDFTSFNSLISIVTSAYVMLIGSFVPIPGGTGGLEYGFMAFYGNFITGTKLTAIMLSWRLLTYYLGMIIGAIAININEEEKK